MLQRRNGEEIPIEWTVAFFSVGSESYFMSVARDLADRRAAEDHRLEAERLKILLEIAGGAAYEINQPLTAILGYAEIAMDLLDPGRVTRPLPIGITSSRHRCESTKS